jgi:death-on-curing protein
VRTLTPVTSEPVPQVVGISATGSALESAFQTFGGIDLYPSIEEKAARLGYSLISNHAFVDGNKRIGVLILLVFLEINGFSINTTSSEVTRIGLGVASGEIKYDQLLSWVKQNCKNDF